MGADVSSPRTADTLANDAGASHKQTMADQSHPTHCDFPRSALLNTAEACRKRKAAMHPTGTTETDAAGHSYSLRAVRHRVSPSGATVAPGCCTFQAEDLPRPTPLSTAEARRKRKASMRRPNEQGELDALAAPSYSARPIRRGVSPNEAAAASEFCDFQPHSHGITEGFF
ncbi:hypothetical protein EJB05_01764 [Eragrostis curvula]|uniref:Uncharacterized protein n=1 Tax=Eragrostis curvula TaxID=38414 RepID=A0A5J9WSX3_9POAL|nr:hypothetical protein EJB05_01764 [Eragrostis curvula]